MRKATLSGKRVMNHERFYNQYFQINETPVRAIRFTVVEAVKATQRNYGHFTLLSNGKIDAMTALELFRNKDLIEKAFDNIKCRLNLRCLLVLCAL